MIIKQRLRCKLSILIVLSAAVRTGAIRTFRAKDVLNNDRDSANSQGLDSSSRYAYKNVSELYIEQHLDHFPMTDNETKATFKQRYFYSDRYTSNISRANAPVYAFLCVGGEGPSIDKSVLVDSVHCTGDMLEMAKRLYEGEQARVHLFALEHRYYGKSYPEFKDKNGNATSPVTNENLVFLSSRQALADIAHFISSMNDAHDMHKNKWITFGGSYPGMMAAWARLEYPKLIHAAVSNSAPIEMKLDFGAYNDRVAFDLQYPLVGGSAACLQVVMDGHQDIVDSIGNGYHKEIASLFHVCGEDSLLHQKDVEMLVGDGVIEIPAQGNDPHCDTELCNIQKVQYAKQTPYLFLFSAYITYCFAQLCKTILELRNHSSPLEVLATISKIQRKDEDECLELDWNSTLRYLASPAAQKGGLRSWLWQTCQEFGFYQTCEDKSLCPFARGFHSLEIDFEICEQAFGVSREDVAANVAKSHEYYGGWNMDARRILSVNGDVDPWSMLALTTERGDELPTHWVKGASHHFWTHPVKKTDGQEVMDARDIIYLKVIQWLEEEDRLINVQAK